MLLHQGFAVTATYRDEPLLADEWRGDSAVNCVECDLTAERFDERLISPVMIWLAHLDQSRYNDREAEVNVAAFERMIDACGDTLEQLIFVSSGGSIYGEPESLPISESHERRPLSSYGKAKLAIEDLIGELNGVKTAILRPGNIYGFERPGMRGKGVIAAYLRAVDEGGRFTLIHNGVTVRDLIHVDDVSKAIIAALNSGKDRIVWNVATGVGTSIRQILDKIDSVIGRRPQIERIENYDSDVLENILAIDAITSQSDWRPGIALSDGLSKVLDHWRTPRDDKDR